MNFERSDSECTWHLKRQNDAKYLEEQARVSINNFIAVGYMSKDGLAIYKSGMKRNTQLRSPF